MTTSQNAKHQHKFSFANPQTAAMKFGLEIYEKMMLSMPNLFLVLLFHQLLLTTIDGK